MTEELIGSNSAGIKGGQFFLSTLHICNHVDLPS